MNQKNIFNLYIFSTSSAVTSQINNLSNNQLIFGYADSYGNSTMDMPTSSAGYYVIGYRRTANYQKIVAFSDGESATVFIRTKTGGQWGSWN